MSGQAQHYVPQLYLRNFAKKRKKRYYLACYHKPDRRQFVANVANLAQETSFYDIPADPTQCGAVEGFFRRGESKWALAIRAVLENGSAIRLLPIRTALSEFAATLMSRTLSLRTEVAQIADEGSRKLLREGAALPEMSPEDVKRVQASLLIEHTSLYASILAKMAWIIVTNKTRSPFWTSDNPLVKYNPEKDDLQGNLGLLSSGIQLYLPLSPTLVLGFIDPDAYGGLPLCVEANTDVVQFCNSEQVAWSLRYLFSRQADFTLADAVLDANPLLADPDRARVVAT